VEKTLRIRHLCEDHFGRDEDCDDELWKLELNPNDECVDILGWLFAHEYITE
jgi:hypothetical protein